jgi:FeS assembly SUF system protein
MNDMSDKDVELKERIISALKEIYDPEIPVNIYDLGLIYRIDIDENAIVHLDMTLTAPGCPVAQTFPIQVADAIRAVSGVEDVELEMVWDPPWSVERMTEEAKVALGFFD